VFAHEYVGDDDSSTTKVLQHLWQDKMDQGMKEDVLWYGKK
jgi:hypothetical protein